TIFVRVWNLGRLPAIGVAVRVWWANPAFSFDDPAGPGRPQYIGGMYVNLGDRTRPDVSKLVRVPTPWIPTVVNGGHECLLAKTRSFIDQDRPGFHAEIDRHVAQRNITVGLPGTNLAQLADALSYSLPADTDVELVWASLDQPVLTA